MNFAFYSLTEVSDLIGFSFRLKVCLGELTSSKRTRHGPAWRPRGAHAGGVLEVSWLELAPWEGSGKLLGSSWHEAQTQCPDTMTQGPDTRPRHKALAEDPEP